MIRPLEIKDLAAVMEIWLQANLQAHPFIAQAYWRENFETVKSLIPQSKAFVCEVDSAIAGFIGLTEDGEIAGLFVAGPVRGRGIGKQLIGKAKWLYGSLTLSVYQKNERAVQFYRREGFLFVGEQTDQETGELEYRMRWERQ